MHRLVVVLLVALLLSSATGLAPQVPKYSSYHELCKLNPLLSDLYVEADLCQRIRRPADWKFCVKRYGNLIKQWLAYCNTA